MGDPAGKPLKQDSKQVTSLTPDTPHIRAPAFHSMSICVFDHFASVVLSSSWLDVTIQSPIPCVNIVAQGLTRLDTVSVLCFGATRIYDIPSVRSVEVHNS